MRSRLRTRSPMMRGWKLPSDAFASEAATQNALPDDEGMETGQGQRPRRSRASTAQNALPDDEGMETWRHF